MKLKLWLPGIDVIIINSISGLSQKRMFFVYLVKSDGCRKMEKYIEKIFFKTGFYFKIHKKKLKVHFFFPTRKILIHTKNKSMGGF